MTGAPSFQTVGVWGFARRACRLRPWSGQSRLLHHIRSGTGQRLPATDWTDRTVRDDTGERHGRLAEDHPRDLPVGRTGQPAVERGALRASANDGRVLILAVHIILPLALPADVILRCREFPIGALLAANMANQRLDCRVDVPFGDLLRNPDMLPIGLRHVVRVTTEAIA